LHFEYRVNGIHHDPQTLAHQSETIPVAAAFKPAFEQSAAQVRAQLSAATNLQSISVQ
jgi:hypothetical protein